MNIKWIQTIIIAIVNLLLWVIPGNVAYLIAQNRDILLGRYSITQLTWAIFLIPVSLLWLYLIWSNEENKKKRQFQVTAIVLSIIIPVFLIDLLLRLAQPKQYIVDEKIYHRAPDSVFKGTIHDVPENAFAYPQMRPGYPDIEFTLTTDKVGFRNKTSFEKCDIIALGDSFTEGSNIDDEDIWTVKLAQKSNMSVCNLGMAGSYPERYMETLKKFGIALSPGAALCVLYEGNDFRDSNYEREDTITYKISNYFKASPLRIAIRNVLINKLSSSKNKVTKGSGLAKNNNAESEKEDSNSVTTGALSWLPAPVPPGPDAKYYTFTVKNLCAHFVEKESFLRTRGCKQTLANLRLIKKLCSENKIHLIIVYAPDKSHVLMPLICDNISAETLREFMALKAKKLPPADKLEETVLARLDNEEQVFKEFCEKESLEFISLTLPLRKEAALGRQVYFTYDDHWTPIGHEVVADTINDFLNELPELKTKEQVDIDNPG
jgi:hypothetical protein